MRIGCGMPRKANKKGAVQVWHEYRKAALKDVC